MRRIALTLAAVCALVLPAAAQMLSNLPLAGPVVGTEAFPINQAPAGIAGKPTTKQVSLGSVAAWIYAHQPAASSTALGGVLTSSAPAHQFAAGLSASGSSAALQYAQPAASDISGLAPSATIDTTKAANILGLASVATSGRASDLSGALAPGQLPTLNGDLSCTAGSTSLACLLQSLNGQTFESQLLPHVLNNGQLKTYAKYAQAVTRDGFSVPGDGGNAVYTHAAGTCSINAGAGDNGAQVQAADGGCWSINLSRPVSAAVWGVKSDGVTDDLAAWQAATSAMGAAQGDLATFSNVSGTLLMPGTNGTCSRLSGTLLINRSSLTILGAGAHVSCFDPQFATGNGVQFGDTAHYLNNVKIENVSFRSDTVHRTGGSSLQVWNVAGFSARNVGCYDYYYSCFGVDQNIGGNDYNFDEVFTGGTNGVTLGSGVFGLTIGASSTGGGPVQVRLTRSELTRNGYGGTAGAAINIMAMGGLYSHQNNTDFNYQSVWIHPGTGQSVGVWQGTNDTWDTQTASAIVIDTTSGGVVDNFVLRGTWVATCGSSTFAVPCVDIKGPTGTIVGVDMDFAPLFASWGNGISVATGTDIRISGHITGNGLQNPGNYNGIVVVPPSGVAVKDLQIDARIGGSIGADGAIPPNLQNCAVYTAGAGSITNLIGKGDWSGNRYAPGVCDNSVGTDLATHDFSDTFPGAGWLNTAAVVTCTSGSTGVAANAAHTMRYQVKGKSVNFTFENKNGSDGSCLVSGFGLPFVANSDAVAFGSEFAPSGKGLVSRIIAGSGIASLTFSADNSPVNGGNNATEVVSGVYERQ